MFMALLVIIASIIAGTAAHALHPKCGKARCTQDAYGRGAEERRRALPWRQRYDPRMHALFVLLLGVVALDV